MDLNDTGNMSAFPALLKVDLALGTYDMPGGIREVVKMARDGLFARRFRLLATGVREFVLGSAPGVTALTCEPVLVIN